VTASSSQKLSEMVSKSKVSASLVNLLNYLFGYQMHVAW